MSVVTMPTNSNALRHGQPLGLWKGFGFTLGLRLSLMLTLSLALIHPEIAIAQTWPTRTVKLVVPYAPGGPVDVCARILAERLTEVLGQSVVVENKAGGNAVIGTMAVINSAPDGYTFLVAAPAHTGNMTLMKKPPYDAVKDFAPVSLVMLQPMFVVVHPSVPANTIGELITLLKNNPDKYNYGTSGSAGPQHLMGEMFKSATGTKVTHVPYKGAAPASTALLAGEMQISFSTPTNTFPYVKAGKLRALAVSTPKRSIFAPELPTLVEQGLAGFEFSSWTAILAPAGAPRDAIQKLYEALQKVTASADIREKFFLQGMEVVGSSPEQTGEFIRQDVVRSAKIIRENNITAD
jgi:tripartite-type tricarboxylate transporter receptor subunit TctC